MDYEAYEKLVLTSINLQILVSELGKLDDTQRKALSTKAQKLLKQLESNKANKDASKELTKHIKRRKGESWQHWQARDTKNARLGIIAVGPLTAVKRLNMIGGKDIQDAVGQIVADRRPDWTNDWIDANLAQEFSSLDFPIIWDWVKSGVANQPASDGFYASFANYMMSTGMYGAGPGKPISKVLKSDPELIPLVDTLFTVESNAFNTNAWFDKGKNPDHESWTEALIKLCGDGTLNRDHILKCSVEGLSRDLKQNQLSGFHKFHKAMSPTGPERAALQSDYLALLTHPVGHVAKFGLSMLDQIQKDGTLEIDLFARESAAIFLLDAKGNAMALLKMLARILKSKPSDSGPLLDTAIEGLRHGHADVPAAALKLLDQYQDHLTDGQRGVISESADFLAATNQAALAALIGTTGADTSPPDDVPVGDIEELVGSLSKAEKDRLGLTVILESEGLYYAPIAPNINQHKVLTDAEPITPIQTEDELIEAISHAVEIVDSPDDMERIFDGISRLCEARSDDFDAKVAPVLKRIEKGGSETTKGLRQYGGMNIAVMDLILTWLTGKRYVSEENQYRDHVPAFKPARHFMRAIRDRVAKGDAAALISAPTHSGGWIDADIWRMRLIEAQKTGQAVDPVDLTRSLLRLAPDNRDSALRAVDKLSGELKRLARFALGGDEKPLFKKAGDYPLWISAARARNPYKDWREEFAVNKVSDSWPDSLEPARFTWKPFMKESVYSGEKFRYPRLNTEVNGQQFHFHEDDKPKKGVKALTKTLTGRHQTDYGLLPSAALSILMERKYYWSGAVTTPWLCSWLSYQWPQNPQGAHMIGVTCLMGRIDDTSSNWDPNYGFMDALFQTGRPWGEAAHVLLLLALSGRDADVKGLAIDALITGIEKGLFNPDRFGQILSHFARDGWVKLNRLGDSLADVIQISELHAAIVGSALQTWLKDVDMKQRGMFRPLEILLEAQTKIGLAIDVTARPSLQSLKGSSKAAKCAKALLALKDGDASIHDRLKYQAAAGRI